MKKISRLFIIIILISISGFSQTTETFDYVSPFNEGFSAVKKDSQWGFINTEGNLVIGFRDDLFSTKMKDEAYPVFSNNRCIIIKKEENVSYYGYIDTSGKTVIKPTFLNATNFKNHVAIVLELYKEIAGHNDIMGKDIVYYTYKEVIINLIGETKENLTSPKNVVLTKQFLTEPPKITSKILSENMVKILNDDKKWILKKFDK
jgi:hypothetical protein